MPSSNKTTHLNLNRWLGTDKPKRDDFTGDNIKIDDAVRDANTSISTTGQNLSTHTGNNTIHITSAERTAWNAKDRFTINTYQGNGAATRKIELGFRPRFGMVYAVSIGAVRIDFDFHNCNFYTAYFGGSGSSEGVAVDNTGFTVTQHASARPNGHTMKLNDSSYTYVYVAWQ